jgi:hypothetical protein
MNIDLHGITGLIVAFLGCAGIASFGCGVWDWLADRFRADLRHLRVHRRWDRPGAHVTFQGGRCGIVSEVYLDSAAGGMAIVRPYDGDGHLFQAEWVRLGDLSPIPVPGLASEDAA